MPSPIFASLFMKKYIVQTRTAVDKPWREHAAYRNLADARQTAAAFARKNPKAQVRILNQRTQQVVPSRER